MPVIKIDDSVEVLTDPEKDLNIEKQAMNMAQGMAAQNQQWRYSSAFQQNLCDSFFTQFNNGISNYQYGRATNNAQNTFYDSILTRMKAAECCNKTN